MTALGTYKLDIGTFPTTEQGLQALESNPATWPTGTAPICRRTSPTIPGSMPTFTSTRAITVMIPTSCPMEETASSVVGEDADIVSWK